MMRGDEGKVIVIGKVICKGMPRGREGQLES